MKKVSKLLLSLAALALLSLALASHSGKTLRMAILQDEGTLTPYTYQTGYPGYELLTMVYDTLYQLDENLIPQPWLAQGAETSADGLTYTITLKPDLKWADGEALTASDVAFTIKYFQDNLHGRFSTPANKVAAVETPDEQTVVITLKAPDATFIQNGLADVPIIPEHVWADVTDPNSMVVSIGSGPYQITEYRTDQFYRLTENANFWGPKPAFDEIITPIIKDQTATFQALQTGEIDVAVRKVSPELVERFAAQSDLKVAQGPGFSASTIQIDVTKGALANPEVRKIMAGLIDYEKLVENVLLGFGVTGGPGFLPPAHPLSNPNTTEYSRYTPEEAKQRLEELGFSQGADGVYVDADGNRLEFEYLTYSDRPIQLRAAELVAQDLREGGFNIELRAMERQALVQRVWPDFDVSKGRNYDMSMVNWSAPVAAQARLGSMLHSDFVTGNLNVGGYSNPKVDSIIEEAAVTIDAAKRQELFFALQQKMAEDIPLITLFFEDGVYAYRPAVYDNWVFMAGQGIINKLSFLER